MAKKTNARLHIVTSFCAICCWILGASQSVSAAPPDPAVLTAHVNDSLGLRASKLANLEIRAAAADKISVALPFDDQTFTLDLELQSVRSPEYRVQVDFGGGVVGEVPAGPVRTYRGSVAGQPGSMVAGYMGDDGLHAKVVLGDGSRHWVEPLGGRFAGAERNAHAVYRNEDVIPSMGACDAHDAMRLQQAAGTEQTTEGSQQGGEESGSVAAVACGTGLCVAEIAADADVEFYLQYGSVQAVEDRVNAVINGLNIEYERDVAIRHVISQIVVRIAEPDPYSATDSGTLLNQFRSQWINNHSSVPRDIAHLFTGKNIDSSVIGIAWIGAICGSYGYGLVQSDCCGSFACATDLSAHELGHNWNAQHCDCAGTTKWTMNPYITCANQFHPTLSVPPISTFRDSRTCLSAGNSGCTANAECDDANPCTTDTCSGGSCFHANSTGPCDDGLFCNGTDTCSGGTCSIHTGNPCPPPDGDSNCSESCNESLNNCTGPDPNGWACNDGLFCNGSDSCSNGSCSVHSGNPCAGPDGDANCAESCYEAGRSCTAADPHGSVCNDGNASTTNDACSAGVCMGTPITVNCDDGNPCTVDTVSGTSCLHSAAAAGTACNDGLFCNGTDACNNGSCILHTGNPCPGPDGDSNCSESCNELSDNCTAKDPTGSACNDGNPSTTGDVCNASVCAGTPLSCDDGNSCTTDTLSGTTCLHAAVAFGTPCDDGLYCNGPDSCNAGTCSSHAGNPCNGGLECANVCNEAANNCFTAANTACVPDSNPCTSDVCNGGGSCTHPLKPAGASCNDSLFCNGTDTCSSTGACTPSGNPCPGPDGDVDCSEACNETSDSCTANDPNGTSCGAGSTCQNGLCVTASYCGDGVCDATEDCSRCPSDCGFPAGSACQSNLDCCSGVCRGGKCRVVRQPTTTGSTLGTSSD